MKKFIAKMSAILLATAAAMALTACESSGQTDSRDGQTDSRDGQTDSRDGKTYKTVKIGKKIWMAENLNYQTGESKCYENKTENCDKYGRLYIWREAVTACPDGWRLPSEEDFKELIAIAGPKAGDPRKAGTVLKSQVGWDADNGKSGNFTDALGFAALPAGLYSSSYGGFNFEGMFARFWSSTESGEDDAYNLDLDRLELALMEINNKLSGFSVRCIKD